MNTPPPISLSPGTSTRPYLIRALHEWCTDNGFTPYVAVCVGPGVRVPMEYVKNNEIVLNVSPEATSALHMGNEALVFKARFGGVSRDIYVPLDHVIAIYARENGQGMAFPAPLMPSSAGPVSSATSSSGAIRAAQDEKNFAQGLKNSTAGMSDRGLRLASPSVAPASSTTSTFAEGLSETSSLDCELVQSLVDGDSSDEPTPPRSPAPSRPSLKRIK